jgi:heme/copper-type cytochrome/quinol oxidase subunit 2
MSTGIMISMWVLALAVVLVPVLVCMIIFQLRKMNHESEPRRTPQTNR